MGEGAIDIYQPRVGLPELVRRVGCGEEVILTENGEPVAKIISIDRARRQRVFGSAKGKIHMADDFGAPLEEFRDYM